MPKFGTYAPASTPYNGAEDFLVRQSGATVRARLADITAGVTNAAAIGADPTGVTDSAPALRAAPDNHRVIVIPPGTYRLASAQSPPPAYYDDACVLVTGLSNFTILGYGATLLVDNAVALSSALHFDRCSHFVVRGLTIQGTRAGLVVGQENAAIALSSCVDFLIEDIHITGNFGDEGAGIAADWLVDGTFQNMQMDAVGQVADVGFCQNVVFRAIRARGADTNGASGVGQIGPKGISIIHDGPNVATNNTGIAFNSTDGVLIEGCHATNFSIGAYVASGKNIVFAGNKWVDNPGIGGALGMGVFISYVPSGPFSSVGFSPSNILINGDVFINNGAVTAGGGVMLDPASISNSDVIENITIANCLFDNNHNTGINATGAAHLVNINLANNSFSGTAQTTTVVAGLAPALGYYTTPTTMGIPGNLVLPNNLALQAIDGAGAPQNLLYLSPANGTVLKPGSALAYTEILRYDDTPVLRLTNEATNPTYLVVNGVLKNVLVGAADSGGTGYRTLIVAN